MWHEQYLIKTALSETELRELRGREKKSPLLELGKGVAVGAPVGAILGALIGALAKRPGRGAALGGTVGGSALGGIAVGGPSRARHALEEAGEPVERPWIDL